MDQNNAPQRVKEQNVRAVAVQVVLISLTAAVLKLPVIMLLLSIDFLIRAFINSRYSLLSYISRNFLAAVLPFRNKVILMKPKKFAAIIGMIISTSAGIVSLSGNNTVMTGVILVLLLFSFLEAFLKFCAGCWMFGILMRIHLIKEDTCEDCKLDTVD